LLRPLVPPRRHRRPAAAGAQGRAGRGHRRIPPRTPAAQRARRRLRRRRLARAAAGAAPEAALPRLRQQPVRRRPPRPPPQPALRALRRFRAPAPLPAGGPARVQRRAALPVRARDRSRPAGPCRTVRRRRLPRDLRPRGPGRGRRTRLQAAAGNVLPPPLRGRRLPPARLPLLAVADARPLRHRAGGHVGAAEAANRGINGAGARLPPLLRRFPHPVHATPRRSVMLRRSTDTGFPMLLYQIHEFGRAWMAPFTYWADANARMFSARDSWLSAVPGASRMAAGNELLHRIGKDYEKPEFGIHAVRVAGHDVPVVERVVLETPFCRLLRFKRYTDDVANIKDMRSD